MNDTTKRGLTTAQIKRLISPRPGGTFATKNGLTYIAAHEVKAELMRIFGPGNVDWEIHDLKLLWEWEGPNAKGDRTMYRACYSAACTLRVRDYWGNPIAETTEYHAEANSNLPDRGEAHAMAVTSVQSYALRRAALSLGDAFGLHLYEDGQQTPLVKGTLALWGDPESPNYQKPPEEANDPADEPKAKTQLKPGGVAKADTSDHSAAPETPEYEEVPQS